MLRSFKLSLAMAVVLSLSAAVATAQKPPKNPPPPPAPPVSYHVQYFSAPGGNAIAAVRGMNNFGAMVGEYYAPGGTRGFLYDPAVDGSQAVDLNDLIDMPQGWVISSATDINDSGALLAAVERTAQRDPSQPDFERHGLVIDTWEEPWVVSALPDAAATVSHGWRINGDGDILGAFVDPGDNVFGPAGAYLYNAGLYGEIGPDPDLTILPLTLQQRMLCALNQPVAGRPLQVAGVLSNGNAFRYTPEAGDLEVFSLQINGGPPAINGYGVFCGRARVPKSKGNQFLSRPFRFDPESEPSPTFIGTESNAGELGTTNDINDEGDVVLNGGFLYRNSTLLDLKTLVGPVAGLACQHCTQRDPTTGFPIIGGWTNGVGCVLTPQ